MAEEHATHEHGRKNDRTTLYIALIAAIIAIAAVFYAATQGDAFGKRILQSEQKQSEALAKIEAFSTKLDAFEKQLETRLADLTVSLIVYYDSDCEFCDNEKLFAALDNSETDLKTNGITLKRVDVRSNYDEILASGIDRVPAFYASSVDLLKEPAGKYLQNEMDLIASGGADVYNAQGGIAVVPRINSEMLTEPCLSNVTTVQYFYSETCLYCKRVKNNESKTVNPETEEQFTKVIDDVLPEVKTFFGSAASITSHCLGVHSRAENRIALGINKSDAELCVEMQSEEKTNTDALLANKYRFSAPPMFAVNCRYLFPITRVSIETIKKQICAARPSLAACKALPQPSAGPLNTQ